MGSPSTYPPLPLHRSLYLNYLNADAIGTYFLVQLEVRVTEHVVCSDAENILGIGDQGVIYVLLAFAMDF